jgi:hypothetical protein
MPTVITAQSGAVIKQNTRLSVGSCKIKLLSHKVRKHMLIARVKVFTAGRLSLTGSGVHVTYKKVGGPGIVTIKARFSNRARHALASGHAFRFRLRVGFNPKHKGEYHSAVFAKVTYKH